MIFRIVSITLLFFFSITDIFSQPTDSTKGGKKLIRLYTGGRSHYSIVSVKLYSDSSFEYYCWYHFGKVENAAGIYSLTDSTLTLKSNRFLSAKQKTRKINENAFANQKYRIDGKLLLLFTNKQEKEDAEFYRLYFTLHLRDTL